MLIARHNNAGGSAMDERFEDIPSLLSSFTYTRGLVMCVQSIPDTNSCHTVNGAAVHAMTREALHSPQQTG